jgi:hypothetical protein
VPELSKPPWHRRTLTVILAGIVVLVTVAGVAWWRAAERPTADATAVTTAVASPASLTTTSTTSKPASALLWRRTSRDLDSEGTFEAPPRWRIVWSFDCRGFAGFGGGNFKISGEGAFAEVSIQHVSVGGRGSRHVTGGGRGRLVVETVCDSWTVEALRS